MNNKEKKNIVIKKEDKDQKLAKGTFGKIVVAFTIVVILLSVLSIILNSINNTSDNNIDNILNVEVDIFKEGDKGTIVVDGITEEEFLELNTEENLLKLKEKYGLSELKILPSGSSLREWENSKQEESLEEGLNPPDEYKDTDF